MVRGWTFFLQIGICIAAIFYFQFKESDILKKDDIKVVFTNEVVESLLDEHKHLIGNDIAGYRNHIYRVLSYTNHFLQNSAEHGDVIAAALVYHDIGLWTKGTLAYLEPSAEIAKRELSTKFNEDELKLLEAIIVNHHKITPFKGENKKIVEAVRRADWIDASNGLFNKGMPWAHIATVKDALPHAGFYDTLMAFGPRLYGNDYMRIVKELSTLYIW